MKNKQPFEDIDLKVSQEILISDIENILSTTPFHSEQSAKKDFFFRLSEFYKYRYMELNGGDYRISKGNMSFELNSIDLNSRIKEAVENKIKDDLNLYLKFAIDNSLNLTRNELNVNLQKVLSTQGYGVMEHNGDYTFSKGYYTEVIKKNVFENLIKEATKRVEEKDLAEKRFISKVDSALLLTGAKTPEELKNVFISRMKINHDYECRITEKGDYCFIPDYNTFVDNKRSFEINGKELDLKMGNILNSKIDNKLTTSKKTSNLTNDISL